MVHQAMSNAGRSLPTAASLLLVCVAGTAGGAASQPGEGDGIPETSLPVDLTAYVVGHGHEMEGSLTIARLWDLEPNALQNTGKWAGAHTRLKVKVKRLNPEDRAIMSVPMLVVGQIGWSEKAKENIRKYLTKCNGFLFLDACKGKFKEALDPILPNVELEDVSSPDQNPILTSLFSLERIFPSHNGASPSLRGVFIGGKLRILLSHQDTCDDLEHWAGPDTEKGRFAANLVAYVAECGMVKRMPCHPFRIGGKLAHGALKITLSAAQLKDESQGRFRLSLRNLRDRELDRSEGTLDLTAGKADREIALSLRRVSGLYETRLIVDYEQPNWRMRRVDLLADLVGAPNVRIAAQGKLLAGSTGAFRITVTNHKTGKPMPGAEVALMVHETGAWGASRGSVARFAGATNAAGTVDFRFAVPVDCPPQIAATATVKTKYAPDRDTASVKVRVLRKHRVLLSTDKPFYRPGDTVHMRAVVLGEGNLKPEPGLPVYFGIREPGGNSVFRERTVISPFGVASAAFRLAKELRTGDYLLVARTDTGGVARRDLEVKEYVLPKFKITADLDREVYLPSDTIRGSVGAAYFFGKAVAGGKVEVRGMNGSFRATGATRDDGRFSFEVPAGKAKQGPFAVEVRVTDGAGHVEHAYADAKIVESPLAIGVFPEAGEFVAGVPNKLYVRCTTVTGEPVEGAAITVESNGLALADLISDAEGIASFEASFALGETPSLVLRARDRQGRTRSQEKKLGINSHTGRVLARPRSAWPKVGEELVLDLYAPGGDGQVCVDVFRSGHLVRTPSAALDEKGKGHVSIALTEDLAGALAYRAYRARPSPESRARARPLLVRPASLLTVEVTRDAREYSPGGEAKVRLSVRDETGVGRLAQVGMTVVDESVFALSEVKPGVERYFFLTGGKRGYFGTEGSRPRVEIEEALVGDGGRDRPGDGLARYLMASLPPVTVTYPVRASSEPARRKRYFEKVPPVLAQHLFILSDIDRAYLRDRTVRDLRRSKTLNGYFKHLVREKYLRAREAADPWGTAYRYAFFNGPAVHAQGREFGVASAGPDLTWRTADDVVAWRQFRSEADLPAEPPIVLIGNVTEAEARSRTEPVFWSAKGASDIPYGTLVNDIDLQKAVTSEGLRKFLLAIGAMDAETPDGQEDAISDIPLGGSGIIGFLGVGGGGGGCYGFRSGGGRRRAALRGGGSKRSECAVAPRVRRFFPETLFVNPGVITDLNGRAEITVPLADSITDWRLTAMASGLQGRLGSALSSIRVFQPFFVDLDVPAFLTRRDEIVVPVAIHNYLPRAQSVRLEIVTDPGLALLSVPRVDKRVAAKDVTSVGIRLRARRIGRQRVKVTAFADGAADSIERVIDVRPDGMVVEVAHSAFLDETTTAIAEVPYTALPDSVAVYLRLYPGVLSQTIEGLEKMLRKPYGCFEQTWSTTYPNLLVLDYLEARNRADSEAAGRARELVNEGYQRLLRFEIQGGGFSLFGRPPADEILTAYGLNGFSDMAKVHPAVDRSLIDRTRRWLVSKQKADGSWSAGRAICHAPAWRQSGDATILATAYVAAAVARSGSGDEQTKKALAEAMDFLDKSAADISDPYVVGVVAGAYAANGRRDTASGLAPRLAASAELAGKTAWWQATIPTWTGARNELGKVEATGEVARVLGELRADPVLAERAVRWLVQKKRPGGGWGSTQATILALKALLANARGAARSSESLVKVRCGRREEKVRIVSGHSGRFEQVDLTTGVRKGRNPVNVDLAKGKGGIVYQLVTKYAVPWRSAKRPEKGLELRVDLDRRAMAPGQKATCKVALVNRLGEDAAAAMIELGVPPGFSPDIEVLRRMLREKKIARFDRGEGQVILYLEALASGAKFEADLPLTANLAGRVQTPPSSAYLYYNPDVRAVCPPSTVTVATHLRAADWRSALIR